MCDIVLRSMAKRRKKPASGQKPARRKTGNDKGGKRAIAKSPEGRNGDPARVRAILQKLEEVESDIERDEDEDKREHDAAEDVS